MLGEASEVRGYRNGDGSYLGSDVKSGYGREV